MPLKPQLEHIMTFIKVVELSSFSAAADDLAVSKSVVSAHVSTLEQALQCQLLIRSTRKLSLTDAGLAYYNNLKTLPDLLSTAQNCLLDYNEMPRGILKVIAPMNLSHSLKKEIVPGFLKQYPDVTLQLSLVRSIESHLSSNFDVLIMWKLEHENFPDYPFVAKRLLKLPVGLYASPNYLKKHGTPKTPDDLLQHNCFSAANEQLWPFTLPDGKIIQLSVRGNLKTTDDDVIHGAVCEDVGIAYSYSYFYLDALKQGTVVPVLEEFTHVNIEVYACYMPGAYVPLKISCFIEKMRDYYQKIQAEIMAVD